jgi:hypothetical protein
MKISSQSKKQNGRTKIAVICGYLPLFFVCCYRFAPLFYRSTKNGKYGRLFGFGRKSPKISVLHGTTTYGLQQ